MSNTSSEYKNPWLDIASYQLADAYRFKGREEDVEKYLSIINNRTMSVLYANSGIGKTSFINAGIIPQIIAMGFIPIHIRFPEIVFESRDIEGWLYNRLFSLENENANRADGNRYYWSSHTNETIEGCETSLWWLLHTAKIHESGSNNTYTPIIIFDQFEELFVKSQQHGSLSGGFLEDFFGIIQVIASKAVPRDLSNKLEVKIYQEGRFISIGSVHDYKVVFSLRKEYLSDFDYWTNDKYIIPELYRNRMYLLPLTREQAERVITQQPNPEKDGECIDTLNDVKDIILDRIDVKGTNEVEPLMLSVLCSRLYDEAMSKGINRLTKSDVESINIDTLIATFYNDIVKDVIEDAKSLSEFEEQMVDRKSRRKKVISSSLLNGLFDKEYEITESVGKTKKTSYKKELEDKHIIRVEKYNGEDYVELIHDRIAEIISNRNEERIRRIANLKKYKSRQNILTLAGRRLMDNCGFDFSEGNSRIIVSGNTQSQLKFSRLDNIHSREYDGSDNVFVADMLNQIVGKDKLFIHFDNAFTKDGFAALEINTVLLNSQRIINGIVFYDTKESKTRTCSAEGFNSINIDYDSESRELRRIYNNSKDGVNVSGVTCYEIAKYDENGFPLKILFKDEKGMPCKHFDGNYGLEFKYDVYGNEIYRRYLAEDGISPCKIYNQVCGLRSEYDGDKDTIYNQVCGLKSEYDGNKDRVTLQYFVDENGEITEDVYGIVGVKYSYDDDGNISKIGYIGKDLKVCKSPYEYSIEKFSYRKGKIYQRRYYDKDGETLVNRIDGELRYSILDVIDYDDSDRIKGYILRDTEKDIQLIIVYEYDSIGRVSDTKYYAEKDSIGVNPSGVHHVKYDYYDNGLIKSLSYYGINNNLVEDKNGIPVEDKNGTHKVTFEWDDHGRLNKRHFFKTGEKKPYNSQTFEYKSEGLCDVTDITYIDSEGNRLDVPIEEIQKWIINHRFQAKEIIFGKDNNIIPGKPVRVKYKYDIAGNVMEYRFFDIGAEESIPNEDGDYGYQTETNNITGEIRTKFLDRNGKCSKNKHPYAIIVNNSISYNREECDEVSYYNEDNEPALCELGYHKKISSRPGSNNAYKIEKLQSFSNDELDRLVEYFDCNGTPCDCVNGYSRQQHERESISDGKETKITVSFWGADGTRRINKELGFHKREQIISTEKGLMETSRSFMDENDSLINVGEGFAKQTCKRYDSFGTFFYYPFCDHDIIRFYDCKDQKVDVNFGIQGKTYHAYKYTVPLEWSTLFKVNSFNGKTLYRDWTIIWKYIFIIIIPLVSIVILLGYPFYELFKKLNNIIHPKKKVDNCTIVRIMQVYDKVEKGNESIVSPAKSIGIREGFWIVKWNEWVYNKAKGDTIEKFEKVFNAGADFKSITIYNPSEKQFFNLCIREKNLGLRLQDAEASIDSVNEMMGKALSLSPNENAEFLRIIYSNMARQYKEGGEYDKAEELYRKQIAFMEKQGYCASQHDLADVFDDLGVCIFLLNRYNEAVEALEHALELIDGNNDEIKLIALIHNHLSQAYRADNNIEKADYHNDIYENLKKRLE